MGFVDNQHIPVQLGQVAQLVVLAAEIFRAFHVLQTDKLNALIQLLALCGGIQIALLVQHMGLPGKGIHMTDEQIAGLPAQKAHIVAVPAIGDGRAIGDNKHRLCIDLLAEVVDGEGLAKAGLGVPEVFPAGVALVIGFSVADSSCLLLPQCRRWRHPAAPGPGSCGNPENTAGTAAHPDGTTRFCGRSPHSACGGRRGNRGR